MARSGVRRPLDAFHYGGRSSAVGPPGIVMSTWRRGGFLRMAVRGVRGENGTSRKSIRQLTSSLKIHKHLADRTCLLVIGYRVY